MIPKPKHKENSSASGRAVFFVRMVLSLFRIAIADAGIEQLFHLRIGSFGAQGNDNGDDKTAQKAGHDFIDSGSGEEDQPKDIDCGAGQDSAQGAGKIKPLPEKRKQMSDNSYQASKEYTKENAYKYV